MTFLQTKGFEIEPEIAFALEHDPPALDAETEDEIANKNTDAELSKKIVLRNFFIRLKSSASFFGILIQPTHQIRHWCTVPPLPH